MHAKPSAPSTNTMPAPRSTNEAVVPMTTAFKA